MIDIATAAADPALTVLSHRYAAAVDRRDINSLLSVFRSDATLRARPVGRNPMILRSHGELVKIVRAVEYWPRTFHCIGQALHRIDGDEAEGEVYCVAHHFSSGTPGVGDDYVMYIRYLDRYAADPAGRWLIAERDVVTDAVERRDLTGGGLDDNSRRGHVPMAPSPKPM